MVGTDTDPISARAAPSTNGLDAVVPAALQVAVALAELHRSSCSTRCRAPPVATPLRAVRALRSRRVLSQVRALLAKAESTTFEPEAETFTAGAQALMARHSIDAAMLAAAERTSPSPPRPDASASTGRTGPKVLLLAAVADANRCRTVWSSGLGFVTVIGFETDQAATETIFTSLLVQATAAMTAEGRRVDHVGQSRTRAFRQSFLTAYAHRIGARLREVTDGATAAARTADTGAAADAGAGSARPGRPHHQRGCPRAGPRRTSQGSRRSGERALPPARDQTPRRSSDVEGWSAGSRAADRADLFSRDRSLGRGQPPEGGSIGP